MPRGPFEGTWQQGIRPTVVTAPDALVYINGEVDILGCPKCRRKFDWNKYITSIQVDLSIDSVPGSASISLSVPRHSVDEFYFDGNPLITPMMEIEIFAKGFFLVEGLPQYYPIFWGLVTEVTDSYSAGEHTFSINCADILKWWELCKMNINPAFTAPGGSGQLGKSIFGNVLFGTNPYDLIWTLAQQAFGDLVVGTGSLVSLYKEGAQKNTFSSAFSDIMLYWNQRFQRIRSNLLLYGTQGNAVRGDELYANYSKEKGGSGRVKGSTFKSVAQTVRQANGGDSGSQMVFDPTDPGVTAFRTQFSQAGQVNFWSSEYQTKLEIANACKEAIGFEFYMDVTGDIVFKPPFYNLDILSNKPISWIQDIDIISWSLSESEGEVVTQIQLQGSYGGNVDYGMPEEATPFTSVTDYHLLRKYGWRTQTYNSEFMGDPLLMFYTGLDLLDRFNSKRFRASVEIPFRPELRLGFPIYLASKDQVWYIQGISHNIAFGGRAQTTLSLTAKREKFIAPKGIGTIELTSYKGATPPQSDSPLQGPNLSSKQLRDGGKFKATVGDAAQLPPDNAPTDASASSPYEPLILRHPKTGRLLGYPNVVMAYTRPFTPTPDELRKSAGKKDPATARAVKEKYKTIDKEAPKIIAGFDEVHTATEVDRLREKHITNRYSYGLNSAGVYTYLQDLSSVVKDIVLLPAKNVDFGAAAKSKVKFEGNTGMIRPVSDERGFEVVGHFRYGRGVSLRDGSLVLNETDQNPGATNSRALVSSQLALGGGLYETLQSQSLGLTTKPLFSSNPVDALARLTPEDLQTGASINPNTKQPQFTGTDTTFVDTAPLNSPEQAGAVNSKNVAAVEASQLSRALTLAEMSVRDAIIGQDDCDCLLGRSDLAFINVGYQLRIIGTSEADDSTLGFGALSSDLGLGSLGADARTTLADLMQARLAAGEAAAAQARKNATNDPFLIDKSPEEIAQIVDESAMEAKLASDREFDKTNADAFNAAVKTDKFSEKIGLFAEAFQQGKPVGAETTLSKEETISRVEQFLTTLYIALDGPHQELEKALRGETLAKDTRTVDQVRFDPPPDPGGIAPPFSVPGRSIGGDPAAIALAGSSAREELSQTWGAFGDKLASNTEKAKLQGEIGQLTQKAAELAASIEATQKAQANGSTFTVFKPTIAEQQTELDKTLQDLASAQQKLNVLNQKYP